MNVCFGKNTNVSGRIIRFVFIFISLILVACGGGGDDASTPPTPERITLDNTGIIGIFDPSVTKDPVSGQLWMSYSTVDVTSHNPVEPIFGVSIRLAYSDDSGVTWTDAGIDVASYSDAIVGPLPVTSPLPTIPAGSLGTWQSETSTLIYDPSASLNERWKIIWHQYLKADSTRYFLDYGWIAMKMAASPIELAGAVSTKLFAGFGLLSGGENTGSPAFSPIGGPPEINLSTDLAPATSPADVSELEFCIYYEPELHITANAIYFAAGCAQINVTIENYIVLFKCTSPCDMTDSISWQYLGRIASPSDAQDIGYDNFSAPDIVEHEGEQYLIMTPVDEDANDLYSGCRVYKFGDISTGILQRTGGVLDEFLRIDGALPTHNGACTDHADLTQGIIYSQLDLTDPPEIFKMYHSFKTIQ